MKTFTLLSVTTFAALTQWSLPFSSGDMELTHPFTEAPQVAMHVLDD